MKRKTITGCHLIVEKPDLTAGTTRGTAGQGGQEFHDYFSGGGVGAGASLRDSKRNEDMYKESSIK